MPPLPGPLPLIGGEGDSSLLLLFEEVEGVDGRLVCGGGGRGVGIAFVFGLAGEDVAHAFEDVVAFFSQINGQGSGGFQQQAGDDEFFDVGLGFAQGAFQGHEAGHRHEGVRLVAVGDGEVFGQALGELDLDGVAQG